MTLPYAEPYKIKMTEAIRTSTRAERETWIREASYNLFKLRSDQVTIDLLTDSGTGSMSDRQWAAMMTGDESYAGASSYFRLRETISRLFGMPFFLPTHQGRAAENVIFSALLKEGDIVPGNSHFDTTKGHIEFRRCHAVDCTIDDAADTQKELPFKGEMDIAKLEKLLRENPREKVPCVVLTITNNTAGGQPVSMRNIRETAEVCRRYGVPLLLDSARFAENAYFIKMREDEFKDSSCAEILKTMCSLAELVYFSARKVSSSRGGGICTNDPAIAKKMEHLVPLFEGFLTYGGISVREIEAMAVGLYETTDLTVISQSPSFIEYFIGQMVDMGIPCVTPAGGLGAHIDAGSFLSHIPQEDYPAGALAAAFFIASGVRGMERGTLSSVRDENGNDVLADVELLRLAFPRRVFTLSQVKYTADRMKWLYDNRELIGGLEFVEEPPVLRFFMGKLRAKSDWPEKLAAKYRQDFGESL